MHTSNVGQCVKQSAALVINMLIGAQKQVGKAELFSSEEAVHQPSPLPPIHTLVCFLCALDTIIFYSNSSRTDVPQQLHLSL